MRKSEIIDKLKSLETFIENVSSLQMQLFKELRYESVWIKTESFSHPNTDKLVLRKISNKSQKDKPDKKLLLTNDERHTLFEYIKRINPKINMVDDESQMLLNTIDWMITEKVKNA